MRRQSFAAQPTSVTFPNLRRYYRKWSASIGSPSLLIEARIKEPAFIRRYCETKSRRFVERDDPFGLAGFYRKSRIELRSGVAAAGI